MNTQTIALPANDNILAILNFNKIEIGRASCRERV